MSSGSIVWNSFEKKADNDQFATCITCHLSINRGQTHSTSAMRSHLLKRHPKAWAAALKVEAEKKAANTARLPRAPSVVKRKSAAMKQQHSIDMFATRSVEWSSSDPRAKAANKAVLE